MISLKKVGKHPDSYRVICSNSKCRNVHYTMSYASSVCPSCGRVGPMPNSIRTSAYSRLMHHTLKVSEE